MDEAMPQGPIVISHRSLRRHAQGKGCHPSMAARD